VFGVAFGNVLLGAPFRFDETLRVTYAGDLFGLFSPFAVLCGLISVMMIAMHGGAYLAAKTEGEVRRRARRATAFAALATGLLFLVAGLWAAQLDGYVLTHGAGPAGPSNPLLKTVVRRPGALMANYRAAPWTLAAPTLGVLAAFAVSALSFGSRPRPSLTFVCSGSAIAGVIATAGVRWAASATRASLRS
jgi:cytochrome bd ubiquinol oxidase subunit II